MYLGKKSSSSPTSARGLGGRFTPIPRRCYRRFAAGLTGRRSAKSASSSSRAPCEPDQSAASDGRFHPRVPPYVETAACPKIEEPGGAAREKKFFRAWTTMSRLHLAGWSGIRAALAAAATDAPATEQNNEWFLSRNLGRALLLPPRWFW